MYVEKLNIIVIPVHEGICHEIPDDAEWFELEFIDGDAETYKGCQDQRDAGFEIFAQGKPESW